MSEQLKQFLLSNEVIDKLEHVTHIYPSCKSCGSEHFKQFFIHGIHSYADVK